MKRTMMFRLQVFTMDGSMGDYIWRTVRSLDMSADEALRMSANLSEDYRLIPV